MKLNHILALSRSIIFLLKQKGFYTKYSRIEKRDLSEADPTARGAVWIGYEERETLPRLGSNVTLLKRVSMLSYITAVCQFLVAILLLTAIVIVISPFMSASFGFGASNWMTITQNANNLLVVSVVVLSATILVSIVFGYYMSKATSECQLLSLGATRILSVPTSICCLIVIYGLYQLASTLSGQTGYPPSYIYSQFLVSIGTLNTAVTIGFLLSLAFMIPFAKALWRDLGNLRSWMDVLIIFFFLGVMLVWVVALQFSAEIATAATVSSSYGVSLFFMFPSDKKLSNSPTNLQLERRAAIAATVGVMIIAIFLYMPMLWLSVLLILFGTEISAFATELSVLARER